MFDTAWITELDADGACQAIGDNRVDLREVELQELVLAAHWADLHGEETLPADGGATGGERAVRLGATGTPEVAEFASAELAVLMGVSPGSAMHLVRDAL